MATHDAHVSAQAVEWLLAVAVTVYLVTLAGLHLLGGDPARHCLLPSVIAAVLVLVIAAIGPTMGVSVLLVGTVIEHGHGDRFAEV